MYKNVEFFIDPDGEVLYKPRGGTVAVYKPECVELTTQIIQEIRDIYPRAYESLSELYSKSEANRRFFEYRMAHRFIRCYFGEHDLLKYDIGDAGQFNIEEVRCPLRGECINEGIICKPEKESGLSEREKEIAKLLGKGLSREEIALELYISIYTVDNHISKIKRKLGVKKSSDIILRFSE